MTKTTYDSIKADIPLIVRQILENQNEAQRQIFAEEFSKKYCTQSAAYFSLICLSTHRWYLGKPMLTLLQWVLISSYGIGLIWTFIDIFLIPELVRERNSEIAKAILAEQATFNQKFGGLQQQNSQPLSTVPPEVTSELPQIVEEVKPTPTPNIFQGIGFYILFFIGFGFAASGLIGSDQGIVNGSHLLGGIGLIISGILLRPHVQKNMYAHTPIKGASAITVIIIGTIIFSVFMLGRAGQEKISDLRIKAESEYAISPDKVTKDILSYAGKGDWETVQIMTSALLNTGNPKFQELHDTAIKEIALEKQRRNTARQLEHSQKMIQENNQKFESDLAVKAEAVCRMLDGTGLTMGCTVNYAEKSVDVKIDTVGSEANKICRDTSEIIAGVYPFRNIWSLRIFSPFASRPMATCVLK